MTVPADAELTASLVTQHGREFHSPDLSPEPSEVTASTAFPVP